MTHVETILATPASERPRPALAKPLGSDHGQQLREGWHAKDRDDRTAYIAGEVSHPAGPMVSRKRRPAERAATAVIGWQDKRKPRNAYRRKRMQDNRKPLRLPGEATQATKDWAERLGVEL